MGGWQGVVAAYGRSHNSMKPAQRYHGDARMVIEQEPKLVVWIWDAIRSQKEDQTMVVEIWTAFRARGPRTFPGNRSVFFFGHDEFMTGCYVLIPCFGGAETEPFNRPGNLQKKQYVYAVGFF